MFRRVSILLALAAIAFAALAATSPTIVRRISGDFFVEGQVFGSQDLHFDGTNSVKEAITNHTHHADRIVAGILAPERLGSNSPSSARFLRGDSQWAEIPDDTAAETLGGQVGSWYLARSNHTGTQAHTTITGLGGLAVVNDPVSDGKVYGRSLGGWAEVVSSSLGTNNPLAGDILIRKALPTLFFSDDISETGGGIVFGSGGFVVGPANYGNPDYVGTPWMEISTDGDVTIPGSLVASGDGQFTGTVSGEESLFNRATLSTASNTNAPASGKVAIFLRQVGGKGQLVVRFPTGADQVIATEP